MSEHKQITPEKIWLGIDPGLARLGYGLLTVDKRLEPQVIAYGCLTTKTRQPLSVRLLSLYENLNKIIKKYNPHYMAVEQIYFAKNAKTALTIGHARGIILLAAALHNMVIQEFTPLQIKQALTGYGFASKNQMGQMVKIILKLKEVPKPDDTADALAIAISGIQFKNYN